MEGHRVILEGSEDSDDQEQEKDTDTTNVHPVSDVLASYARMVEAEERDSESQNKSKGQTNKLVSRLSDF